MKYHISTNGAATGPFTEEELQAKIRNGEIATTSSCWAEGWSQWRPVSEVFPQCFQAAPPPPPPSPPVPTQPTSPASTPSYSIQPQLAGVALASLIVALIAFVIGLPLSALLFPFLLLFYPALIVSVILGHVARAKIKKSQGTLTGAGVALAGLIIGYTGIVIVPIPPLLFAGAVASAAAIPAFSQVRSASSQKTMDNDARQIAAAAQQYCLEYSVMEVPFGYDRTNGKVSGPLAVYVPTIQKGYSATPSKVTIEGTFQLAHPSIGASTYDSEGKRSY